MKRIAVVTVSVPPHAQDQWRRLIGAYADKVEWVEPLNMERGKFVAYCYISTEDQSYEAFLRLLTERALEYPDDRGAPDYEERFKAALRSPGPTWAIARIDHVYSDEELRRFPLLVLEVDRKEITPCGPNHGTTYDLSPACPRCGCGAVQTSPFYAPAKSFPRTGLIVQSSTETFVAERLADALRRAETTGLELRQVHSTPDHVPLPWYQIIPRQTLPRMSPATKGLIRGGPAPCPVCRRDGHYHTVKEPFEVVYAAWDVDPGALPDVVQTWECFGVSRIDREDFKRSRFAEPAILVKPQVFDIFRKLKVKHARFGPVQIMD